MDEIDKMVESQKGTKSYWALREMARRIKYLEDRVAELEKRRKPGRPKKEVK